MHLPPPGIPPREPPGGPIGPAVDDALARELAGRRAAVLDIDPRLSPLIDRLTGFICTGGKRLRPEFLWWGWRAGGGGPDPAAAGSVVAVGAALELLQASALLHDDIIDRSDTRRGAPSMHRAVAAACADSGHPDPTHFGVSAALLLGDLALVWADDLYLDGARRLDAVGRTAGVWRAMRTEVLAGQLLDLLTASAADPDPAGAAADAMRVNRFKTASYTVERPLHLGAALAGGAPETVAALRRYGMDVGAAFQLRDDLLGVYGDPAVTGKPAGDDLAEGKRTLMLATARAALADRPALLAELDAGIGSASQTDRLTAVISESGAPDVMERRIAELVTAGTAALQQAGAGGRPAVPAEAAAALHTLAVSVTDRRR